MTTVTVLDDYQNVVLDVADWRSLGEDVRVVPVGEHIGDPAKLAPILAGSEVLVLNRERTRVTAELLENCPDLKLIVTLGMRNPVIDMDAAAARGVLVCGTKMLAHPTVELTWALITSLARGVPDANNEIRAGSWQSGPLGFDLNGATLGVAGFGRLGKAVARIGRAFGMEVIVHSRSTTQTDADEVGATAVDKQRLLAESDVLTLHLPGGPATKGFIGAAELSTCKPGLRLVNTSRGPVVEADALVAALREGRIAGAALDVYDVEPLEAGHPLLSAPNTVLTPHLGYVTDRNYRAAFGEVIEDIAAWRAGSPIREIR